MSESFANPFTALQLGLKPEQFNGRQAELHLIYQGLSANPPAPLVVQGPRWSGKTSLLRQVISPESRETHAAYLQRQDLRFHWIDCAAINLSGLYRALLQTFTPQSEEIPQDDDSVKALLQVRCLLPAPRQVFLLDQFDHLAAELDPAEQKYLRGLMACQAFLLAVENGLDLPAQEKSPLLGLFTILPMKLFSETETRTYLQTITQPTRVSFNPAEMTFLHEISGGHPYLLNLVSGLYFDTRIQYPEVAGMIRDPAVIENLALQMEALPKVRDMFAYYFEGSNPEERSLLAKLASGTPGETEPSRAALQALTARLLVRFTFPNRWSVFAPLFAEYLNTRSLPTVRPAVQNEPLDPEALKGLTQNERRLLIYLMSHTDRVCTFEELSELLWNTTNWNNYRHSLDATIYRLRLALERQPDGKLPTIQSVRGKGFRFLPPGQLSN